MRPLTSPASIQFSGLRGHWPWGKGVQRENLATQADPYGVGGIRLQITDYDHVAHLSTRVSRDFNEVNIGIWRGDNGYPVLDMIWGSGQFEHQAWEISPGLTHHLEFLDWMGRTIEHSDLSKKEKIALLETLKRQF